MQDKWYRLFRHGLPDERREQFADAVVGRTVKWGKITIYQSDPTHLLITVPEGESRVELYEKIPPGDKQLQVMKSIKPGAKDVPFELPVDPVFAILFLNKGIPDEALVYARTEAVTD